MLLTGTHNLFICLIHVFVLAALGLRGCYRLSLVAVHGLLIVVAALVVEHKL